MKKPPPALTFPTVHLNGSGEKNLVEWHQQAHSAVQTALEALCQAAPNARDYYVQAAGAFKKAQTEHEARVQKLQDVLDELEAIVENVYEQGNARSRR